MVSSLRMFALAALAGSAQGSKVDQPPKKAVAQTGKAKSGAANLQTMSTDKDVKKVEPIVQQFKDEVARPMVSSAPIQNKQFYAAEIAKATVTAKGADGKTTVSPPKAEDLARIGRDLQVKVAKSVNVPIEEVRELDAAEIDRLLKLLVAEKPEDVVAAFMLMRHGEQQKDAVAEKLSGPEQKAHMMRKLANESDKATVRSLVELVGMLPTMYYLSTKRIVTVDSSTNPRAWGAAQTIANGLKTNAMMMQSPALKCKNYVDEKTLANADLFKSLETDGSLAWVKEKVDVAMGKNTYDTVMSEMKNYVSTKAAYSKPVKVAVTHTQQLNAAVLNADEKATPKRIGNYGFYVVKDGAAAVEFANGLFKPLSTVTSAAFATVVAAGAVLAALF